MRPVQDPDPNLAEPRVAIVTGGTSGIGLAITTTLAARGYAVVALSNAAEQAEGTQRALTELGLAVETLTADVAVSADVERVVRFTLERHGRVDVLCNNAGIYTRGTVLTLSEGAWDRTIAVNLKGMFLFARAVIPHMIAAGGGAIVNTASISSYGNRNLVAYCAAKAGVLGLTRALAIDHAPDHIRVNAVVPGFILSGMTQDSPPERLTAMAAANVAGRVGQPQDVANMVAFLVSDEAATISGAFYEVSTAPYRGGSPPSPGRG
jgi:NAD(P)-dependent dehydrogenase (short-subunit alcohol dehydrogenase family)